MGGYQPTSKIQCGGSALLPTASWEAILEDMPATTEKQVFGPSTDHTTQVSLPHVIDSGKLVSHSSTHFCLLYFGLLCFGLLYLVFFIFAFFIFAFFIFAFFILAFFILTFFILAFFILVFFILVFLTCWPSLFWPFLLMLPQTKDSGCRLQILGTSSTSDTATWYELWEAATAVWSVCLRQDLTGGLSGLGKSLMTCCM